MNRLIRIFISFVLPFFYLLTSVSNAEFTDVAKTGTVSLNPIVTNSDFIYDNTFGVPNYTYSQAYNIVNKYVSDSVTNESTYNQFITDCKSQNIDIVIAKPTGSNYNIMFILSLCDVGYDTSNNSLYFTAQNNNERAYVTALYYRSSKYYLNSAIYDVGQNKYSSYGNVEFINSSTNVKLLQSGSIWLGEYYFKISGDEPDSPSLPTNAEIAQAVQAFYNSDYYKNNKDFEDFIVMYNYNTKYFSFIGHKHGSNLGQVIVPPGYEYEGNSYDDDWWKFFLRNISSEISSNLWNRYYWLYSTNDLGQTFTYNGKGAISDLLNLHFATSSIIVYSTTDYPVVKIETNEETGALEPVQGTVPGDQYTYDENLDPTTNEYNPLENFVPTNPIQDILGDVDFEEINKTFEENKDILNIEGASWLFTANNNFISYFIGFLSLLIVFLLISRILGG